MNNVLTNGIVLISYMWLFSAGLVNGKYCCSQLFVNHRCFSGPYLNKGRIAELPQAVGPGKCAVVLKEVQSTHLHVRLDQDVLVGSLSAGANE